MIRRAKRFPEPKCAKSLNRWKDRAVKSLDWCESPYSTSAARTVPIAMNSLRGQDSL